MYNFTLFISKRFKKQHVILLVCLCVSFSYSYHNEKRAVLELNLDHSNYNFPAGKGGKYIFAICPVCNRLHGDLHMCVSDELVLYVSGIIDITK